MRLGHVHWRRGINFDGCVQLNDLLDLLSAYVLWGRTSSWQCGDPDGNDHAIHSYQIGYDYENLRNEIGGMAIRSKLVRGNGASKFGICQRRCLAEPSFL